MSLGIYLFYTRLVVALWKFAVEEADFVSSAIFPLGVKYYMVQKFPLL